MTETLRDPIHFACPFCQKKCIAGETAAGVPTVLHAMPYCETFALDEGPEVFLARVNRANSQN